MEAPTKDSNKKISILIRTEDVIIPQNFQQTLPNPRKIKTAYSFYKAHRDFDREIVLNGDYVLIDGYVAYLVARMVGREYIIATMEFEDKEDVNT